MKNIVSHNNIRKKTQVNHLLVNNISAKRYSINVNINNFWDNKDDKKNLEDIEKENTLAKRKIKRKTNWFKIIPKIKKLFKRNNLIHNLSILKSNDNVEDKNYEQEQSEKNHILADKMWFLEYQNYFNKNEKYLKNNQLWTDDFNFTEEDKFKDDNYYQDILKTKNDRIRNLQKKRIFKEENTFININEMNNFEKLKISKRNIFIHWFIYTLSTIRLVCQNIINFPLYDPISTIVIILNSIFLTFDVPGNNTPSLADDTQDFFLYFYTGDMILKILANGLIFGKNSYLKSAWNILDGFIVIGSFIARYILSNIGINISALRTLRVLRPLKTINNIKKLKTLISTIISALPNLFEIIVILIFVFLIFAIAGWQLLNGQLNRQCFNQETGNFNGIFCSTNAECNLNNLNTNVLYSCAKSPFTPQHGVYNFDSLDQSFLMVFLITTQEGWSDIMTFVRRTYSDYMIIYFILIIFIGSFFLLNLVLAVIIVRFNETQKHENDEELIEPGGIVFKHYKKCICYKGLNFQKSKLFDYFIDLSNNIKKNIYFENKKEKIANVFMNTMNKLKVENPYKFKLNNIYNEKFIPKEIKNEIKFKNEEKKIIEKYELTEERLESSSDSSNNSENSYEHKNNKNIKAKNNEDQINKYKDQILNFDNDDKVKPKINLKKFIKKQNFNLNNEFKLLEIMRKSKIQNFNISEDEDHIEINNDLYSKFNKVTDKDNILKNDPDFQLNIKNEEIYNINTSNNNIDDKIDLINKNKKLLGKTRTNFKENTLSSLYNSNARNSNRGYKSKGTTINNKPKNKIKQDKTKLEKWVDNVNKLSKIKGKYLKLEVLFCKQYNPHPLFDSRKDIMPSLKIDKKRKFLEEKYSIINNTKLNMVYDHKKIKEKYKREKFNEKNKIKDDISFKEEEDSYENIENFNDTDSGIGDSISSSVGSKTFNNIFHINLNKVDFKNNYYPISNSLRGKESLKQLYKNQFSLLKNKENKKLESQIKKNNLNINSIYHENFEGLKELFEDKIFKNKINKLKNKKYIKINKLHELIADNDLKYLEINKFNYSGNDVMGLSTYHYDRTIKLLNKLNNPKLEIWVKHFYGKILIFRRICREFIDSKFIENILTIFVLLNTFTLSLDGLIQSQTIITIISDLNIIFTSVFALEMFIKIIGYGIRGYSRDFFNIFDGVVVILSLVELVINQVNGNDNGNALSAFKAVKIFRTFRVLRVTRILRSLRFMKVIIEVITRSLEQFVYIALLLFLFIFIFSLIGMQVFGGTFKFNPRPEDNPRFNFDNFFHSFLTTFQLLTLENWNDVLISVMRSSVNNFLGISVLIIWIFVGNFIFLNLFLAILLDGFTSSSTTNSNLEFDLENEELEFMIKEEKLKIKKKSKKKLEKNIKKKEIEDLDYLEEIKLLKKSEFKESIKSNKSIFNKSKASLKSIKSIKKRKYNLLNQNNFNDLPDSSDEEHLDLLLKHRKYEEKKILFENVQCKKSLFIFDINSKFRIFCAKICSHDKFETVILLIIILSSFKLILETYIYDEYSYYFDISDYIINGLFIIEASWKIIKSGFYICPGSYLRDNWSVLDFIIVFFSILDMGLTSRNLGFIKILRTLRTLRPLRFISHNNNMKIMVNALLESIGAIVNVVIVILMIWIMFSILGMNLLSNKLKYCNFSNKDTSFYGIDMANCVKQGGVWQSHNENFDNIFNSMTTLFILSSQESWPNIMGYAMDADANMPIFNGSIYNSFFFIGFLLVGALFLMNLFIGVIFFQFTKEQNKENKKSFAISQFLTDDQLKWILMQKLIENAKPKCEYIEPPKNKLQLFFFKISTSFIFETFIMICIILNIFVMGVIYDGMTSTYNKVLEYINYFFTSIFIIEFLFKIIGLGPKLYFMNDWNKFDFSIVLTSILDLVFEIFFSFSNVLRIAPQIIRVLKLFRITRLFKLIRNKSLQGINKILKTLIFSFPALLNVLLLLILVYFIFSILGVFIFKNNSYTINNPYNNNYWNFNNFGNALLILFRCSTGEGWNEIMFAYSLDTQGNRTNDITSRIFFMIFIFLSSFIMINMFVLIIIDQFEKYYFNPDNPLNSFEEITEQFSLIWNYFTHKEHGYRIKEIDLVEFFSYLREPLGYRIVELDEEENSLFFDFNREIKTRITQNYISREIFKMNLKVDSEGFISFGQILHAALKNAYGRYSKYTEKHIYKLLVKEENKSLARIIKKNKELKKKFENDNDTVNETKNEVKAEFNPFMNWILFQLTFQSWVRFVKIEKGILKEEDDDSIKSSNSNEKFDESYIRKLIEENRNDQIEESSVENN